MNNHYNIQIPQNWRDYQLIDSGMGRKLERFGPYVLDRPEPQAIWPCAMPEAEWKKQANAIFSSSEGGNREKGNWDARKSPEAMGGWHLSYSGEGYDLRFKLSLSGFKHVGIFPEQADNWEYIFSNVKKMKEQPKVLNLFAYTGGASVAARKAGAQVTHVDAVKSVLSWAKETAEASGVTEGIRWIADDALAFVKREARRGNVYNGIILDPPAYGRGPDGEKWVLEENLLEILEACKQILHGSEHFLILNVYSLGWSPTIIQNAVKGIFPKCENLEVGELALQDSFEKRIPLSIFARFSSV